MSSQKMKVLVVGGGGREHALCWKIAQSPLVEEVLCAPGNAGTASVARNVDVGAGDLDGLEALAVAEEVGLVVVGPEAPLCAGLADRLRAKGLAVFGPGASGARLEGSKTFAKDLLRRHRIPTAASKEFYRSGDAKNHAEVWDNWPAVIKADGLAAGKGVFICNNAKEAQAAIDLVMEEKRLGTAGDRILFEEFVVGEELSVMAITDGQTLLTLDAVQDHKQVGDGDTGPNTGGMGAYSPVPQVHKRLLKQIEQRVMVPTLHALRREGIEFRGVIYAGLMITEGGPLVLEYNVRFGDPEVQALVRRFQPDLFPYLLAAAEGRLADLEGPEWDARTVVGVVAATEGYPGSYAQGAPIEGLEAAEAREDVVVFHAGTCQEDEQVFTSGGRVLCVTAMGGEREEASEAAYAALGDISWEGMFARSDIGTREASRAERAPEAEATHQDRLRA
jgi:phosphoribosylamine--glycine ligase